MKKIAYILVLLLEIACLSGAYIIHYFAERRLGMVRYLNYQNRTWENKYPMEAIVAVTAAAVALLTVLIFLMFLKRRKRASALIGVMNLFMIVLSALFIGFTVVSSVESMAAYYFTSLFFGLAVFLQIIKTGIAVEVSVREKENS